MVQTAASLPSAQETVLALARTWRVNRGCERAFSSCLSPFSLSLISLPLKQEWREGEGMAGKGDGVKSKLTYSGFFAHVTFLSLSSFPLSLLSMHLWGYFEKFVGNRMEKYIYFGMTNVETHAKARNVETLAETIPCINSSTALFLPSHLSFFPFLPS